MKQTNKQKKTIEKEVGVHSRVCEIRTSSIINETLCGYFRWNRSRDDRYRLNDDLNENNNHIVIAIKFDSVVNSAMMGNLKKNLQLWKCAASSEFLFCLLNYILIFSFCLLVFSSLWSWLLEIASSVTTQPAQFLICDDFVEKQTNWWKMREVNDVRRYQREAH